MPGLNCCMLSWRKKATNKYHVHEQLPFTFWAFSISIDTNMAFPAQTVGGGVAEGE